MNLSEAGEMPITSDGAREVIGLPLLELDEGTGAFDFRAVRIGPGGISADHSHSFEQANFILSGHGHVELGEQRFEISPNDFIYVPPNVRHVFVNAGEDDLVLLAARGPRV
jgi:mannose-6-phosphate isomerase-like protein (cupin superfamily)